MNILLSGGAGYIGSHTAVEFALAGHSVTIADNLANSSLMAIEKIRDLTQTEIAFHHIDLLDAAALD
jgi:UDP-glucose 4-epimerase